MESVRLVFDYFCERTPRSFVETRDSSVVWNYKYADVEFGRLQVRMRRLPPWQRCHCRVLRHGLAKTYMLLQLCKPHLQWYTMVC